MAKDFYTRNLDRVPLKKKLPLFDLQIQYIRRFLNICCYYNYTAEHAETNTPELFEVT